MYGILLAECLFFIHYARLRFLYYRRLFEIHPLQIVKTKQKPAPPFEGAGLTKELLGGYLPPLDTLV